MNFTTAPLPGRHDFGLVITGLTPSDIDDPKVRKALYDHWIERGLLVFKGMDGERGTQVKLSGVFGELEPHPLPTARLAEYPVLSRVSYDPQDGWIVVIGNEERGGYLPWHSDLIYLDRINRGGLLRPVEIPYKGGETGFIDQVELYNKLPDDLKARIEGLRVIYHAEMDITLKKFGKKAKVARHAKASAEHYAKSARNPLVTHPMVFTQAETGRKVLNVSPQFAQGIEGMENPEGDALLARIIDHCEDETVAYYHQWQLGDMVLWDNWRMLHSASGVPIDARRVVERTTIKGDYALGRFLRPIL